MSSHLELAPQPRPSAGVEHDTGTDGHTSTAIRLLDVERPIEPLRAVRADGSPYRAAMLLVRRGGRPVGTTTLALDADGMAPKELIATAIADLADEPPPRGEEHQPPSPLPSLSVVVCTCADDVMSVRCVRALLACDHQPLEVIVVENRPDGSSVALALEREFADDGRVRCVAEPRRGLANARNAGLAHAAGEIVAFTDDDIVVDRGWAGAAAAAFGADVGCVTGLLLPLSLDTPEQALFERFAGFSKGLARRRFQSARGRHDPLFPYAAGAFGSGANTTIRRSVALRLGGFDAKLGAGTAAAGGEDLDMYVRLLLAGETIVYEPAAVACHEHPSDARGLRRRVFSYGVGLTAMLTKQIFAGPRLPMLRAAPAAIRYLLDSRSRKNAGRGGDYPRALVALELLGMAAGPFAYLRSALRAGTAGPAAGSAEQDRVRASAVGVIDLDRGLRDLELGCDLDGRPYSNLKALLRIHGDPLAVLDIPCDEGRVSVASQAWVVRRDASAQLARHATRHRCAAPEELCVTALANGLPARLHRAPSHCAPPFVSVVVPTAGRPERIRSCIEQLQRSRYPSFEIIVVDNAPADRRTRAIVEELAAGDSRCRYVAEPRPGSSVARNRGVREAAGALIAFTDDDVHVDPEWLTWIVEPFRYDRSVGVVTGLVMPARLDTPSQRWFEELSGFGKGLERRVFDIGAHRADERLLYPYWGGVFGSGNSMAFRASVLRELGGFDPALGAGSRALAGADVEAFSHAILAGHRLVYEPRAVCWHDHRVNTSAVERQIFSYGVGLTAILTKWIVRDPRLVRAMLAALARLLAATVAPRHDSTAAVPHELRRMREQLHLNRRQHTLGLQVKGYLLGPVLYVRSVVWARRLRLHRVLTGWEPAP